MNILKPFRLSGPSDRSCAELLDLSRIEGGVFRLAVEKVDVAEAVRSCVKAERERRKGAATNLRSKRSTISRRCADPKALHRY